LGSTELFLQYIVHWFVPNLIIDLL